MTAIQKAREALEAAQKRAEALHDVLFEAREAIRVTLKPDTPAEIRAIFDKLHSAIYILRGDPLQMHMAAILAALDAETEVKVRELEWTEEISDTWWIADRYRIERCNGGEETFTARGARDQMRAFETIVFGVSFEAAKAAAQADYERRIRSALVPPESQS